MRRIKRIILLLILIVPIMIYAYQKSSYNDTINTVVNDYITTGKYANSHDKYIISDSIGENHLLKEDEFLMSILSKSDSSNKKSYLFDGSSFWLKGGTIVKSNGKIESNSGTNYIKVVEYVKPGIKVTGSGTLGNPWSFDPVYRVEVRANENGSTDGETVKYVTRGDTPTFNVIPNSGYRYISNNCCNKNADGTDCYDENTKIIKVPEVKGNTTCTLIFGTGRYEIKLNKATPSVIYANYKDNYYSDKAYKNPITKLTNVEPKVGYDFMGYRFKNMSGNYVTLVDKNKNIVRSSVREVYQNETLDPYYKIKNPGVPTINSDSVTLVRGYQDTTLTCTENTSYDTDTSKYYQFGYASSTANWANGNITWLGSASTTKTYTIDKNSHLGNRYYGCKVYVINNNDSGNKSEEKVSLTTKLVSLVQARIDFDANSGTLSGSNPIYVRYGSANLYKERTSDITSTSIIPTRAGYSFNGWYTSASGGTKVINVDGTPVANVSGWTNSSKQFILTNTSNTNGTYRLYAYWVDNTKPESSITTTASLKVNKQTATLKCTDNVGVTDYYWGTSAPTASSTYTAITSTTSMSITKEVSSAGTYYLACKDAAGNVSTTKSQVYHSYVVKNMLENATGNTYTTTDYTQSSSSTYIAPKDTTITLTSVYTIPDYSYDGRFAGYSNGNPSTTAATLSKTNPKLTSNAIYTMWFARIRIYFKVKVHSGETLKAGTYNPDNDTWSVNSDGYLVRTDSSGTPKTELITRRYGNNTVDLYDNKPSGHFSISKTGYVPKKDEEWICESGCKSAMTFDQDSFTANYDEICNVNIKKNNCTIVLKVNWTLLSMDPKEYAYTGTVQSFKAPITGTYKLEAWGAAGGDRYNGNKIKYSGGKGGYASGNYHMKAGDEIYIIVGRMGASTDDNGCGEWGSQFSVIDGLPAANPTNGDTATFNGGGWGSYGGSTGWGGAAGGGMTHFSTTQNVANHNNWSSCKWSSDGTILAAGGGGGASWDQEGGKGSGGNGESKEKFGSLAIGGGQKNWKTGISNNGYGCGGKGQGDCGGTTTCHGAGGGGGGYKGGYPGMEASEGTGSTGGAGGGGYTGGVTSEYTDTGIQSGNGKAKISLISAD